MNMYPQVPFLFKFDFTFSSAEYLLNHEEFTNMYVYNAIFFFFWLKVVAIKLLYLKVFVPPQLI